MVDTSFQISKQRSVRILQIESTEQRPIAYVIDIGLVLIASYHSHDQSGFGHSFVCQRHQYIEIHREVPMFVNNTMSTTHTDWLEKTQFLVTRSRSRSHLARAILTNIHV